MVQRALHESPVAAILGPRQCGKTTLARTVEDGGHYFDLENPLDLARLSTPLMALSALSGTVILDEVQRRPDLLPILRSLVDDPACKARFLLLGSASPHLVRHTSESLAGRVSFIDMSGFDLEEVDSDSFERLWDRGGFPRSFLAASQEASCRWRSDFIRTFLERDVPQLGITIPPETLRRFWVMLSHYHGQVWTGADFARSLGTAEPSARRYLDILTGAYVIRQLQPWFENISKRQVKSPKVYVRDTGLLHALLSLPNMDAVRSHPKAGASWEGFVIEQILSLSGTRDAYFWATHGGAELDLLLFRGGKRLGFEIKLGDAPTTTKSMQIALQDLALDLLFVVYPGSISYPLQDRIQVLSIGDLYNILR